MTTREQVVAIRLDDATTVAARVAILGGEENVRSSGFDFQSVTATIRAIAQQLATLFERSKPQKAAVEFGIQLSLKDGKLTALLVGAEGAATLKVSLEWGAPKKGT